MRRFFKTILYWLLFLLVFLVAQLIAAFVLGFLGCDLYSDEGFMLSYALAMGVTYFAFTGVEKLVFKRIVSIEVKAKGFDPVIILAGVILLIALSVVLSPLATMLPPDSRAFPDGPYTLLSVVVLAPILEELIFRGRYYNVLNRNASPLAAASLSAVAFGLVHMEPIVVIEALLVGVILSFFYLSTRSIFAPIILHMCNNAIAYALVVLSYQGEPLTNIIGNQDTTLIVYIVSAVIVAIGAVVILRFFVRYGRKSHGEVAEATEAPTPHDESNVE